VQLQWNFASAKEILHIFYTFVLFLAWFLLEQSRLQMPFVHQKNFTEVLVRNICPMKDTIMNYCWCIFIVVEWKSFQRRTAFWKQLVESSLALRL
jgi:hypothetical protein